MDLETSDQQPGLTELQWQPLPFTFANRYGVFVSPPVAAQNPIQVSCKSVLHPKVIAEVRRFVGRSIEIQVLEESAFDTQLAQAYEKSSSETMQMLEEIGEDTDLASLADSVPETEDLLEQEDDAPIIRLINGILTEAVRDGASDIHIETFEKRLVVRFRIDGVIQEKITPKREYSPFLISRIKVMAKLDIAEKRVPQDGRISRRIGGKHVDLRVSTMPSSAGERVVMRILDKNGTRLDLSHLGMQDRDYQVMKEVIYKPHGVILITGPTGSGKTTTLYAGLTELNDPSRNILTVEDPVEYDLEGIGQSQVNVKAGMTFAKTLRAMLRQDPDVVMVGEIRDQETANIAVEASLTGHLVLSTLHTNTAIGSITRLVDMGVEPFLISSTLTGVVAQRLVRVLCTSCRAPYQASEREMNYLGLRGRAPTIYQPIGCADCNHVGYKGRVGIYEVVYVDEELRSLIHNRASEQDMENCARKRGPGIRTDGVKKVLTGITTIDEVLRVTKVDI